jgi:hypothetical protein
MGSFYRYGLQIRASGGGGEISEMPGNNVNMRVPVQKILGMPW